MTKSNVKAVFTEDFRWRRPKAGVSWSIKADKEPQSFPRDVIEAAVAVGAAKSPVSKASKKAK